MRWQAYFTTVQHLAQYSIHNPNLELLRQKGAASLDTSIWSGQNTGQPWSPRGKVTEPMALRCTPSPSTLA